MSDQDDLSQMLDVLSDQIEKATREIGLYVRDVQVPLPEDDNPELTVLAAFTVGDIALSKKVQDPASHRQDEELREMVGDDPEESDEFARRLAEEWRQRRQRGNPTDPQT